MGFVGQMTQEIAALRTAPADLLATLRDVVEYRKSGLSLNHVVGCPSNVEE
jgi:hypothetical protein